MQHQQQYSFLQMEDLFHSISSLADNIHQRPFGKLLQPQVYWQMIYI
jgi:hypothetical protein